MLKSYSVYYNETRTHLGLDKDTPLPRPIQRTGTIEAKPVLFGLHPATRGYDIREGQHAGCRSVGIRTSSELIPEEGSPPGFDIT